MKTVVVYHSNSGYTEKYAMWLGEDLQADVKPLKSVKANDLQGYDVVIFGSGIYAGRIAKLGAFKKLMAKLPGKEFVIWANGTAPVTEETMARIKDANLTGEMADVVFFYGRSGMDFEKMNPLHRFMLTMMANASAKKDPAELDEQERGILMAKENPVDYTDKVFIAPLVGYVKTL